MIQITLNQLLQIVPEFTTSKFDKQNIANTLNELFISTSINTLNRRAAFIAQTAVESNSYRAITENLNYSAQGLLKTFPTHFTAAEAAAYARQPEKIANRAYCNRMGNGDENSGDGWKYRGRGFLQLTGKDNYTHCAADTKFDFVGNPDYAATVSGAFVSAVWYWEKHKINDWADKDDIKTVSHIVNGGYNGLSERSFLYATAKKVLGTPQP
jgi:putative chitinase